MAHRSLSIVSNEIAPIAENWRYLIYRAYIASKLSVRRSVFGFLFEPIMLLISTYAIAIVWSKLFGKGAGQEFVVFFLYVLTSFCIWNLISGLINSLSGSLLGRIKVVTNTSDPILNGVLIDLVGVSFSFFLSLPMVFLLLFLYGDPSLLGFGLFLYGLVLVLLTGLGLGLILGIACLFIGDLKAIIGSVMRVAFLLTPIIWQVERLGEYQKYIYWNPFYNYLAICRDSLLTGTVGQLELIIASSTTVVVLVLGLLLLKLSFNRLRTKAFSL